MKLTKQKVIVVCLILVVIIAGFAYIQIQQDEKTIATRFEHRENEEAFTLEEWQAINKDVIMLLEFQDDDILRSIPITYNESEPEKYFRLSLYGEYDSMGTAFLDENSPPGSQNLLINGHSSSNKNLQFTFLKEYAEQAYFENHPTFAMIDAEGEHTYLVISICEYDLDQEDVYTGWFASSFRTTKDTKNMFARTEPYVLQSREVDYVGQEMITLITCNMEKENSRFVIQAVKVMER